MASGEAAHSEAAMEEAKDVEVEAAAAAEAWPAELFRGDNGVRRGSGSSDSNCCSDIPDDDLCRQKLDKAKARMQE